MMKITILLCTFNGRDKLGETLEHLAALDTRGLAMELLVVDNASTDGSSSFVAETWVKLGKPFELILLHMPLPGKSHALQFGVDRSSGELIVVCDDDNHLQADYLQVAKKLAQAYPGDGVWGGFGTPKTNIPLPDWFAGIEWAYACGAPWDEGILTGKRTLWGAGMVIRGALAKTIFQPDHPFLLTCLRSESHLTGGEDDEINYRAWLLGWQTRYTSQLKFYHFLPDHRLSNAYRDKLILNFNQHTRVTGPYWRLYSLLEKKYRFLLFPILKKLSSWMVYRLMGRYVQVRHAGDFLYFLTRKKIWETSENKAIWAFYESNKNVL